MIILLDTSTPTCVVRLVDDSLDETVQWEAGRDLSKGLLRFLEEILSRFGKGWGDITGVVLYRGPGSFTGLRIGHTVMNTLAHAQGVAIIGATGETWQSDGLSRLEQGENDQIVMPHYGADANITTPRK